MRIRTMRCSVAAIVVLAAATVWGQSTSSATALKGSFAGRNRAAARPSTANETGSSGAAALHERMDDLQGTLNKMHSLLKQMQTKAASSHSKDSLTKSNLDMWELMVGELDKQFDQLQKAALAREDMEARRAAMYKAASDKADAEAQRARALAQPAPNAGAGQALPATPASPSATPQ